MSKRDRTVQSAGSLSRNADTCAYRGAIITIYAKAGPENILHLIKRVLTANTVRGFLLNSWWLFDKSSSVLGEYMPLSTIFSAAALVISFGLLVVHYRNQVERRHAEVIQLKATLMSQFGNL